MINTEHYSTIKNWDKNDKEGFFEFVHSIWHNGDMLWKHSQSEKSIDEENPVTETVHHLELSTGGWEANENIIKAMRENEAMWSSTFDTFRDGGHYIFRYQEESSLSSFQKPKNKNK